MRAAACLTRAALYVGNDSGLTHMAAALGVPTLGLYGPSDDRRYGLRAPHSLVVRTPESFATLWARRMQENDAAACYMTGLSVDTVENDAHRLLGVGKPSDEPGGGEMLTKYYDNRSLLN